MAGEGKLWREKWMSDDELDCSPKLLTIVTTTARNEHKRSETTKDYKLPNRSFNPRLRGGCMGLALGDNNRNLLLFVIKCSETTNHNKNAITRISGLLILIM